MANAGSKSSTPTSTVIPLSDEIGGSESEFIVVFKDTATSSQIDKYVNEIDQSGEHESSPFHPQWLMLLTLGGHVANRFDSIKVCHHRLLNWPC